MCPKAEPQNVRAKPSWFFFWAKATKYLSRVARVAKFSNFYFSFVQNIRFCSRPYSSFSLINCTTPSESCLLCAWQLCRSERLPGLFERADIECVWYAGSIWLASSTRSRTSLCCSRIVHSWPSGILCTWCQSPHSWRLEQTVSRSSAEVALFCLCCACYLVRFFIFLINFFSTRDLWDTSADQAEFYNAGSKFWGPSPKNF